MPTLPNLYPVLERWLGAVGVVLLVAVSALIMSKPLLLDIPADGNLPPGGDFAAFYGAGLIANAGDYSVLYDVDTQRAMQQSLTTSEEGLFWYFSYPPIVASVFAIFAGVSFQSAAVAYTALMLVSWLAAAWLARPLLPRLFGDHWALVVAVSLLFWSTFKAVSGGNNTAFTVLILVAVWRLLESDNDVAAGVVGSLLLFKPTFGVPLLMVWILARRDRLVLGGLAGAAVFWVANAMVAGWGWTGSWIRQAISFGNADAIVNGVSASSILGFAQNLTGGVRNPLLFGAVALAGLLWLLVVWLWRNETDIGTLIALTSVVFILGSPHAMAHEIAVMLLTVGVIIDRSSRSHAFTLIGFFVLVALSWANEYQIEIGWSPAFPVALAIGAIAAVEARRWRHESRRERAPVIVSA